MPKTTIFEYKGTSETVSWDRRLCIHVGECGRAKGDLFETGRDPWCDPDLADRANTQDVIARCPTGALALHDENGLLVEPAPADNQVHVSNDGPLYVIGDLKVDGASDDMHSVTRRVALCRCGASKNKPFCDNSHRDIGFHDAGAVGDTGVPDIESGGPLEIKRIPDGPIEVSGNFTIRAGSGRKAWSGRKAYLCRCGQSANKPFCDGAHNAAGFKAE
ncbi:MAG: CDGSH iron-sulfur domain-containing protein [Hyphomonadaceae bacterium]|nr:CDGSH iron-sulfur domain-containing protein [Hyphomonadaceae bacterium]